eukprot:TRINITY_DN30970_c0_g1_i1.p1 TRINITY_DN30970_c0_g1~~TRINITY_DN30970_c0_g1_i1.p1  ORF type:complete len:286 (+),score=78.74 TRINITY_DN30970_c0_g1_i1:367-1224(+)
MQSGCVNSARLRGRMLCTASGDRTCHVVRLPNFAKDIKDEQKSQGDDGAVTVASLQRPLCVVSSNTHAGPVSAADFLADDTVATGSWDRTVQVHRFDAQTQLLATLVGHRGRVTDVRCAGPHLILSSATDGTARLWDVRATSKQSKAGTLVFQPSSGHSVVRCARFRQAKPSHVIDCTTDSGLFVSFDSRAPSKPLFAADLDCGGLNRFDYSPDAALAALPCDSGDVVIVNASSGRLVHTIASSAASSSSSSSSADGGSMATSTSWAGSDTLLVAGWRGVVHVFH